MSIVPVKANVKGQGKKVLTYAFLDSEYNIQYAIQQNLCVKGLGWDDPILETSKQKWEA